jgi:hypothetical protein
VEQTTITEVEGMQIKFGAAPEQWERAKDEMREVLNAVARRRETISYTDLVRQVRAMRLEPHDYAVAHLLGEISAADHEEGRGMRSAMVVSIEENSPGSGFFALAESLGEDVADPMRFWVQQLEKAYTDWSGVTPSG